MANLASTSSVSLILLLTTEQEEAVKESSRGYRIGVALAMLAVVTMLLRAEAQKPISSGAGRQENVDVQTYTETVGGAIEMVRLREGKFTMGSQASEAGRFPDEGPQHEVRLLSFYIGKYEVTQAQWRTVASLAKVSSGLKPNPSHFKGDDLPVENVSWTEAVEFCARLSQATGKTYRLPTEAEWEYAARAMTTGPYDGDLNEVGWYADNSAKTTHPVGRKKANGFGLYDMRGNVSEWCRDWYAENYYSQGASVDPVGPSTGSARMVRGGGWDHSAEYLRSAIRNPIAPGIRLNSVGFRIARTLRQAL